VNDDDGGDETPGWAVQDTAEYSEAVGCAREVRKRAEDLKAKETIDC
jgi:hypothetical protein